MSPKGAGEGQSIDLSNQYNLNTSGSLYLHQFNFYLTPKFTIKIIICGIIKKGDELNRVRGVLFQNTEGHVCWYW